jgi:hypothetical protein
MHASNAMSEQQTNVVPVEGVVLAHRRRRTPGEVVVG